jgi:hypothetical protein
LRKTLSVRLTEEQSNLIEVLRTEKKLSSYISLLLGALLQDRVSTTQFLLGLSDQSVAYNDLQKSTIQANLYEKWLSLKIEEPFADWVATLRSAEIKHFGGLDMPLVDVKSTLLDLLDDLGLELVEKGSTTLDEVEKSSQGVSSTEQSSLVVGSTEVNSLELKDLVASMVQEILSTKSTEIGVAQLLPEAPTEPLNPSEDDEGVIVPKEVETVSESATEPQNEVKESVVDVSADQENNSSAESQHEVSSSQEQPTSSSKTDPLVDTTALMSAFNF